MAEVTAQEVEGIVDIPSDLDLTPFIETASLIVTEDLAGKGLSTARLKQIELYLAAHYAIVRIERGQLIKNKTLNAEDQYGGDFTTGLNLTRYGQQAITFDTSGTLAEMASSSRKARFTVV